MECVRDGINSDHCGCERWRSCSLAAASEGLSLWFLRIMRARRGARVRSGLRTWQLSLRERTSVSLRQKRRSWKIWSRMRPMVQTQEASLSLKPSSTSGARQISALSSSSEALPNSRRSTIDTSSPAELTSIWHGRSANSLRDTRTSSAPSSTSRRHTRSRQRPDVQMRFSSSLSRVIEGRGVAETDLGMSGSGVSSALMAGVEASLPAGGRVAGLALREKTAEASLQLLSLLGERVEASGQRTERPCSFISRRMLVILRSYSCWRLLSASLCVQNSSQKELPECMRSLRNLPSSCSEQRTALSYLPCSLARSSSRNSFSSCSTSRSSPSPPSTFPRQNSTRCPARLSSRAASCACRLSRCRSSSRARLRSSAFSSWRLKKRLRAVSFCAIRVRSSFSRAAAYSQSLSARSRRSMRQTAWRASCEPYPIASFPRMPRMAKARSSSPRKGGIYSFCDSWQVQPASNCWICCSRPSLVSKEVGGWDLRVSSCAISLQFSVVSSCSFPLYLPSSAFSRAVILSRSSSSRFSSRSCSRCASSSLRLIPSSSSFPLQNATSSRNQFTEPSASCSCASCSFSRRPSIAFSSSLSRLDSSSSSVRSCRVLRSSWVSASRSSSRAAKSRSKQRMRSCSCWTWVSCLRSASLQVRRRVLSCLPSSLSSSVRSASYWHSASLSAALTSAVRSCEAISSRSSRSSSSRPANERFSSVSWEILALRAMRSFSRSSEWIWWSGQGAWLWSLEARSCSLTRLRCSWLKPSSSLFQMSSRWSLSPSLESSDLSVFLSRWLSPAWLLALSLQQCSQELSGRWNSSFSLPSGSSAWLMRQVQGWSGWPGQQPWLKWSMMRPMELSSLLRDLAGSEPCPSELLRGSEWGLLSTGFGLYSSQGISISMSLGRATKRGICWWERMEVCVWRSLFLACGSLSSERESRESSSLSPLSPLSRCGCCCLLCSCVLLSWQQLSKSRSICCWNWRTACPSRAGSLMPLSSRSILMPRSWMILSLLARSGAAGAVGKGRSRAQVWARSSLLWMLGSLEMMRLLFSSSRCSRAQSDPSLGSGAGRKLSSAPTAPVVVKVVCRWLAQWLWGTSEHSSPKKVPSMRNILSTNPQIKVDAAPTKPRKHPRGSY